jgi:hypothetical protein
MKPDVKLPPGRLVQVSFAIVLKEGRKVHCTDNQQRLVSLTSRLAVQPRLTTGGLRTRCSHDQMSVNDRATRALMVVLPSVKVPDR